MVKASPYAYRDQETKTVLPGETISQLRNQSIGEEKGLRHLSVLLAQRERELRETIEKQDNTKT